MKLEAKILGVVALGLAYVWTNTWASGWISSRSTAGVVFGTLVVVATNLLSIRLLISLFSKGKTVEKQNASDGTGSSSTPVV